MGLLLVTTEPPEGMEEEFHDWYDTEHIPQRLTLPGFESASRWQCVEGSPRWLALYELASPAALETAEYRSTSGAHSTPWTQRVAPRVGRARIVAAQIFPGDEPLLPAVLISRLLLVRFPRLTESVPEGLTSPTVPGLLQVRLFRADSDLWLVGAFDRAIRMRPVVDECTRLAGAEADLTNLYVPYSRST